MDEDKGGGERRDISAGAAEEAFFETAAFAEFDHWIDESLLMLVARWSAYAAPRAGRWSESPGRRGISAPSEDTSQGAP